MSAPVWVEAAVTAFGGQLGLTSLALNERGVAGVRFENGISLRLENAAGALTMTVGVPTQPTAEALKPLLSGAHPGAQRAGRAAVRAAYSDRGGEAFFALSIVERAVSVTSLGDAMTELWGRAERLWRVVQ